MVQTFYMQLLRLVAVKRRNEVHIGALYILWVSPYRPDDAIKRGEGQELFMREAQATLACAVWPGLVFFAYCL